MHECNIAAHAVCVRTAMLSLCSVLNFLRSRLTREHIASYSQNVMDWITPTRLQIYEIIMRFQRLSVQYRKISFVGAKAARRQG